MKFKLSRLNWATVLLFGLALFSIVISLLSTDYDWDLDHEIYFGQRLYFGELIWDREFHDKLPFVQLLMYFPGLTGSVLIWKLISLTAVILTGLILWALLPRLIAQSETKPWMTPADAGHLALVYVFLANYQPGGITQINAVATSLYVVAIISLFSMRLAPIRGVSPWVMLATSAISTASAISIRPYLAAPIIIAVIWFLFANHAFTRKVSSGFLLFNFSCWAVLTIFMFIAGNVGPYLITGQTSKFWVGIQALANKLNPNSAMETFFPFGSFALIFLGLVFLSLVLAVKSKAPRIVTSWLLLIGLSTLALLAFISTRHWWPHYLDMFIGLATLFLGALTAWIGALSIDKRRLGRTIFNRLLILAMIGVVAASQKTAIVNQSNESNGRQTLEFVFAIKENQESAKSFLAPEDMRIHWQARESRHGFPHAANTYQLLSGWWAGLEFTPVPNLPNTVEKYCTMIQNSKIDFILLSEASKLKSCFSQGQSNYQRYLTLSDSSVSMVVYSKGD